MKLDFETKMFISEDSQTLSTYKTNKLEVVSSCPQNRIWIFREENGDEIIPSVPWLHDSSDNVVGR